MIVAKISPRLNQPELPVGYRTENGFSIALPFWDDSTGKKEARYDFVEFSHGDANLIVTAVNTYPAVAELVKALEESLEYLRGSNPLNMSGGRRNAHLREQAEYALTRFREAQAGGPR